MKKNIILIIYAFLICVAATAQDEKQGRKATEDAFIARMKAFAGKDVLGRITPDTSIISKVEGKDYYVLPGDTYIIDEISSATYYSRKGKSFHPLCNKRFPAETIANRLLLPNMELPNGSMKLTFQKYRYETDSVQIQFKQFVQFCKIENYDAYIGIEHNDGKEMKVDVFLYNATNKWLHIFNLTCLVENVSDEGLTVAGNAWLFIPTSNIRELMGKELPKDFMERLVKKTKK